MLDIVLGTGYTVLNKVMWSPLIELEGQWLEYQLCHLSAVILEGHFFCPSFSVHICKVRIIIIPALLCSYNIIIGTQSMVSIDRHHHQNPITARKNLKQLEHWKLSEVATGHDSLPDWGSVDFAMSSLVFQHIESLPTSLPFAHLYSGDKH